MHIKLLPLWISSKFVYTTFAFCVAFLILILLSPSSFASSNYTFENLTNVNMDAYLFCADSLTILPDGSYSYNSTYYTSTVSGSYYDGLSYNKIVINNPNNCTYWGLRRLDMPYPFGADTYGYMSIAYSNFWAGKTTTGYVSNLTYDVELYTSSNSWYSLARDNADLDTRFAWYQNEVIDGSFYENLAFNFFTGDIPTQQNSSLWGSFGSSCRYLSSGNATHGYFGNSECPLIFDMIGQSSITIYVSWGYSTDPGDWILTSTEDDNLTDIPEWDIIQDNTDNIQQMGPINFSLINPITSWLNLFIDTQCTTITAIPSWFGLSSQTICSPWWGILRNTLSPIFAVGGGMLIFGFAVSWLKSHDKWGRGDLG